MEHLVPLPLYSLDLYYWALGKKLNQLLGYMFTFLCSVFFGCTTSFLVFSIVPELQL